MTNLIEIDNRIKTSIMALACGDALGAPAEFHDQDYIRKTWGALTEMVGGGEWAPGEWTDDTALALCLADGILEDPIDPVPAAGKRMLAWRETVSEVGSTIGGALSAYRGSWPEAACASRKAAGDRVTGNGSLMRSLPVALAYPGRSEMLTQSARLSAMTHWDPEAETCCAIYCLWVRGLLDGEEIGRAWDDALEAARNLRAPTAPDTPGPASPTSPLWSRLAGVRMLKYNDLQPTGYANYVVDCLEAAAWCCLHAKDAEDAIIQAVNLGGEADTIGAVAGGIAGAAWGNLPARWLEKLHQRDLLETAAGRLCSLRRHFAIYGRPHLPAFEWEPVTDRIVAGRNPLSAWDIETLAASGISHILDLREPHEWQDDDRHGQDAVEAVAHIGLERLHVSVTDMGSPTPANLDDACDYLDRAMENPEATVYVHCRAGKERTAAVLTAWYARKHGCSYDAALAVLQKGRPSFRPLSNQARAVRHWLGASGGVK